MKTIGIITNNQQKPFQALIISGIREVAEANAVALEIDSLEEKGDPRRVSLNPAAIDGLLIIANAAPADFLRSTYDSGLPISMVSHQLSELPIPAVMFNNARGIAALVKHLVVDCGRRQIVFVRGIREQIDAAQREDAFLRELMRYSLEPAALLNGEFSPAVAQAVVNGLVDSNTPFDAILAADYLMAIAVVEGLQARGIAVPGQVSVVGFGDAAEAESAGMTTVSADVQELGRRAALQLIHQMDGLRMRGITTLNVNLVTRKTGREVKSHENP